VHELYGEFEQQHRREGRVATVIFPAACL
jgi:hypothetical protein